MPDFSNLKKMDVTEESTTTYVFEDIPGEPSIVAKPMLDSNKAFMNARVQLAVERAEKTKTETKAQRKRRILSNDQLEDDREFDRVLIAKTCAVAWGTAPKDANGDQPEFSEENCLDFLRALPNWMLDPFRGHLSNVYNFVDRSLLAGGQNDGGDALGNS